jgi:hypothetical protein
MDCFDNLIGIHRSCDQVAPISDLYIQDLRGITLKVANAAVNDETKSGLEMIQKRITYAQNAIVSHVRNQFSSKVRFNSVLQNDVVGHYQENLRSVALEAGQLKGIRVKTNQYPYLEFYVSRVWVKLAQAITTNVYVYNLLNNELLDTIEVTTVANVPVAVDLNKGYLTDRQRLHLFICIDSSVSNTFETNLTKSNCHSCTGGSYSNQYISFYGSTVASADQKIEQNMSSINGTNGLSIEYSLNCSVEPFICSLGKQLAWAMLHKAGSEIMKELITSKRHNSIINIDRDDHEQLRDEYEAEYIASMSGILDNLQLPNDICFRCDSRIKKTVAIP